MTIRCFCCKGTLDNLSESDDPWILHAKYYGHQCQFVKEKKGIDYVRVHQSNGNLNEKNSKKKNKESCSDASDAHNSDRDRINNLEQKIKERKGQSISLNDLNIDDYLLTNVVKEALSFGYSEDDVRRFVIETSKTYLKEFCYFFIK